LKIFPYFPARITVSQARHRDRDVTRDGTNNKIDKITVVWGFLSSVHRLSGANINATGLAIITEPDKLP